MKQKFESLKKTIYSNRKMLWYMLCFALLGLIDQRKQSATGVVQMLFGNSTSLVIAALLIPSIQLDKLRQKAYVIWTPICIVLLFIACLWGKSHVLYMQSWYPTVLGVAVWSYLFIYIIKEWENIEASKRIRQPFFWCIELLILSMMLSVNPDTVPYWHLMMYSGFYLIGIKREDRIDFFNGLLNGVILCFFVQQIIAFGFRPYDYLRYRGMYAWPTFNGLFYMISYCATSLKWLLVKEQKACWSIRFLWFFLSTGCIAFMLLTGGRAALIGALLVTVILYGWYDLKVWKSFYKLLLHTVAWLLCVVITFPLVYGCVRYLPTILHHPIWFEGEYVEGESVCSFDSWDSEKYISYEEAFGMSIGRLLDIWGMKLSDTKIFGMNEPIVICAQAIETLDDDMSEKILERIGGVDYNTSISIRKCLYLSCFVQLNWRGHTSDTILMADGRTSSHAHNMFLDMAYRHGILAGVLYLGICAYSVLQVLWHRKSENIIIVVFMLALFCFGMFEQLTMMGQFGVALIWIFFYFAGEDSKVLFDKAKRNERYDYGKISDCWWLSR